MLKSVTTDLGRIQHSPILRDRAKEVRVPDCGGHDEIDLAVEQVFEVEKQIELRVAWPC
jgi:hypothetical protein